MEHDRGGQRAPDPMAIIRQDTELQAALSQPLKQVAAMMQVFDLFRQRGIRGA